MKKITKSVLGFCLAISLVVAGCSNGGNSASNNSANKSDGTTTNSTQVETKFSASEPAWKTSNDPVTLSWYTGISGYSKKWDAQNTYIDKIITDETGVTVDFLLAGNDVNAEFNVMMATSNLPDIITLDRWNSTSLIQTLMDSGMVAPMNQLIEQYDPYFSTILPETMIDWYTQSDGNFYAIPNYYVSPEMLVAYPEVKKQFNDRSNGQIFVRKDIMDQLGITVEELRHEDTLIEALKKVKDAKIQYDGMTVAPIYFGDKDKYVSDSLGVLAGSFGAVSEAEDGSYEDQRTTEEYKNMLKFVNKLATEDLLSLENFTSTRNQIEEKLLQGSVFMMVGSIADYKTPVSNLYLADNDAKYVSIDAIHANGGSLPQYGRALNKGWTLTFINKNSKNADRAIQFIEYLYSEHGQAVSYFGKEGETYVVTEEGKYKLTPEVEEAFTNDWNAASKTWGMESIWWMANDVWLANVKESSQNEVTEYIESLHYGTSKYMFSNDQLDSGNLFDAFEPGTDEANADSKISVYWAQMVPKLIFAKTEDDFEKHYTETMKTMDELGLPSIEAAKNVRVQELKKATGVELVSPKYTGKYE